MMKKFAIYFVLVILLFITILATLPFVFKDKIELKAKNELAGMLDAKIEFTDVNLSFLRNFPNASIKLEDFRIIGKNEFEKDTLIYSEDINLIVNIKSFFSETGYDIRKLEFNDSRVNVRVLPSGKANWEIWKTDSTQQADTAAMNFHLKLHEFNINNADIVYNYESANMKFILKGLNHSTVGDLTADSSRLVTKTNCESLTFNWDGMDYISNAKAEINANIDANLNAMIFKFSENASKLNEIPFSLAGWLKGIPDGWDMDIALKTDKTDFKAILSMIPAFYSNAFSDIKTGGDFWMNGTIKGLYIGDYYPAFDLNLTANNGWFQYPSLPKPVKSIQINANIKNPGRTLDETTIHVQNLSFDLGGNPFKTSIYIKHPMTDTYIESKALGKINLGMIKEVYPLDEKTKLNGIFDINLDLAALQSDIVNNRYENIKFSGKMNISKLEAEISSFSKKIDIDNAQMLFNNRFVDLTALNMKVGNNDISASGKLENFIAYALQNKTLKGQIQLNSNYLNLNDFMSETSEVSTKDSASAPLTIIKIPNNIDFIVQANVKELKYDKMNFSNVNGQLIAANSEVKMNNVALNGFGGALVMNGLYSTIDTLKPKVNFDIQLKEVVFKEIFSQVETLQKFAPIFGKAAGKFSTTFKFNSLLKGDMMPDLATVVGGGAFSTQQVGLKNVPALEALANSLKKSDIIPMTIKDLALHFSISDGKITTKPFNFKVSDVNFTLGGNTGLDKSIAYVGKVQLPDKLNLGKFSNVNFKMSGTFQKPKIELDLKSTATEMVNNAKEKVITEVTKKVEDVKEKALEEARKQKEKAIKAANDKADLLIAEAEKQGNLLIEQANKQGAALIAKATNPLTKKAAEIAAKKIDETARKQATAISTKAKAEAAKIIEEASNEVKI